MKCDKYIIFLDLRIGKDGYKYIPNVKYRLLKETSNAFYLIGRKGFMNKFIKSRLVSRFIIGEIIRD